MKKTITLSIISLVILLAVSCQKEDLPVTNTCSASGSCTRGVSVTSKATTRRDSLSNESSKKVNVVACRACHSINS